MNNNELLNTIIDLQNKENNKSSKEEKNKENTSNDENLRQLLLNKKEKKYKSDNYKNIIIMLAVIVFIGGIIAGNHFKVNTIKDYYKDKDIIELKSYMYEDAFNDNLMFTIWGSGIIFIFISCLINSILKTLEEIKEIQKETLKKSFNLKNTLNI